MDDKDFREKLGRLVRQLKEQQAKCFETREAIEAMLRSEPTSGELVRQCFGLWDAAWKKRYQGSYHHPNSAAIAKQFKKALQSFAIDELEKRMRRYVASSDPFYTKNRHPLMLFFSGINSFGSSEPTIDGLDEWEAARPHGCAHQPLCVNDVEHTKRRLQEAAGPF